MVTFIAGRIEKACMQSLEEGKALYNAYFINTSIYNRYKADVDTILQTDGFGDVFAE